MFFDSFSWDTSSARSPKHVSYSHEAILSYGWLYGTLGNHVRTYGTPSELHWAAFDKLLLGSDRGLILPWCAVFALHLLHSQRGSDEDLDPLHGKILATA